MLRANVTLTQVYATEAVTGVFGNAESRSKFALLKTKTGGHIVATVFAKDYLNYESETEEQELCFIGYTTAGAYFLALKYLAAKFDLKVTVAELARPVSEAEKSPLFEKLSDQGNGSQAAVKIRVGKGYRCISSKKVESIIKKGQANGESQPAH